MEAFDKVHKEFFEDKTKEDCEELFKRSRIYSDEAFYMAREGKISHDDEFAYRIQKTYKDSGIEVSKEEAKQFDKMNLIPEETWFVGDTFEVDVVGAKKAGWHVIWFNHRKRPMPEGDIRPDLEVRTVEELMDVITK